MANNQKIAKLTGGRHQTPIKTIGRTLALQERRKTESTNFQIQELMKPHVDARGQRSIRDLPDWIAEAIIDFHPAASRRVSLKMLQCSDEELRAIVQSHPSALLVVSQLLERASDEELQALMPNIGGRMLALCPEKQVPSDAELKRTDIEQQQKIAEQQGKLQKANDKIVGQERKITEQERKITEQERQITEQERQITELTSKITALKQQIEKLDDELSEYEAKYGTFATNDLKTALGAVASQDDAPGFDEDYFADKLAEQRDLAKEVRERRKKEDAEDFARESERQLKIEAEPSEPGKTETRDGVSVGDIIRHTVDEKAAGLVIGFTAKGRPRVIPYGTETATSWQKYERNPKLTVQEVKWFKSERKKRELLSRN